MNIQRPEVLPRNKGVRTLSGVLKLFIPATPEWPASRVNLLVNSAEATRILVAHYIAVFGGPVADTLPKFEGTYLTDELYAEAEQLAAQNCQIGSLFTDANNKVAVLLSVTHELESDKDHSPDALAEVFNELNIEQYRAANIMKQVSEFRELYAETMEHTPYINNSMADYLASHPPFTRNLPLGFVNKFVVKFLGPHKEK